MNRGDRAASLPSCPLERRPSSPVTRAWARRTCRRTSRPASCTCETSPPSRRRAAWWRTWSTACSSCMASATSRTPSGSRPEPKSLVGDEPQRSGSFAVRTDHPTARPGGPGAATIAVSQRPPQRGGVTESATAAGWKNLPSWYMVSEQDNAIPPDAERFMAKRMEAVTESVSGSHAAFIGHPRHRGRTDPQGTVRRPATRVFRPGPETTAWPA